MKNKVLNGILKTNKDVYIYTLEEGHIPKHAEEVLKKMKSEGNISYTERSPLINYNQIYHNKRIIDYEIIYK